MSSCFIFNLTDEIKYHHSVWWSYQSMKPLFDKVENLSRTRQVVEKFRKAISSGVLKVGDKLPPERELCAQMGVSRSALREAIRILDAYGVLKSTQGDGTYVTDQFAENVFEFLGFGGNLNSHNLKHLLQTRLILESGVLEQSIETANSKTIERLESLVKKLEEETDAKQLGYWDAQFHETIIELSANPILISFYKMIFKMLLQGTSQVIALPNARKIAIGDHKLILQSIKKRDKKRCKQLIIKHLNHTKQLTETYLQEEV